MGTGAWSQAQQDAWGPGTGHMGVLAGGGVEDEGALTKDSVFLSETEAVLCPEGNGEPLKGFK